MKWDGMDDSIMRYQLAGLAARVSGRRVEPVGDTEPSGDLGVSSLMLFEFVEMLEYEFNLTIPDDRLEPAQFATVDSVMVLLHELCRQEGS